MIPRFVEQKEDIQESDSSSILELPLNVKFKIWPGYSPGHYVYTKVGSVIATSVDIYKLILINLLRLQQ